ncbi:MAG: S-methyl-5-thioribose-1-phosphate isomerase [Candidatus Tectomicrobia bacterium]|uniref:Methylthioribose-1-phosphate isomerase n=1 Tax=Tectimicrobiota bacterium TaxID=2528274 RepID=A0A932GMC6_UNCTE|nr:S-methyl-5-thioribose-1-phosphate isomerase [Candidatus Tectomicrobia bacterium]
MIKPLDYRDGVLYFLDQRRLPQEETYVPCRTDQEVAEAIRSMIVRGAPAIGIAAAFGMVLGARRLAARTSGELLAGLEGVAATLTATRPTARNLFWGVERMRACALRCRDRAVEDICRELEAEALRVWEEDIAGNRKIGQAGQKFLGDGSAVLTHCNAGALATGGYGTAIGVVRAAVEAGKKLVVYVDETRPFLQGSRLTAWELLKDGIPLRLITDSMAGHLMKRGVIQAVIVGADRIAANGDVANKIGTYMLAVLAKENGLPFYVAAPFSTIDLSVSSGEEIPIEERPAREVTHLAGEALAPEGVEVCNPAFDVTPAAYVTAMFTDRGAIFPPFAENLARAAGEKVD